MSESSGGEIPAVTPSDLTTGHLDREEDSVVSPERLEPQGRLRLDPTLDHRSGLVRAFGELVSYADHMVERSATDPARSVHEYRKSVRRIRALVKLLRGAMGTSAQADLDDQLRKCVAGTSGLRDTRVLLDALDMVPHRDGFEKARREVARGLGETLAELQVGPAERETLLELSGELWELRNRFASLLPHDLTTGHLLTALRRSYSRARRSFRAARSGGDDDAIHGWRKRVKEFRYQLELLGDLLPAVEKLRPPLARLAKDLGEVTDLIVLDDHIRSRQGEVRGGAKKLRRATRKELQRRFQSACRELGLTFALRPRDFAASLAPASDDAPSS